MDKEKVQIKIKMMKLNDKGKIKKMNEKGQGIIKIKGERQMNIEFIISL